MKKLALFQALVAAGLLLAACAIEDHTSYLQDSRTGLCFAVAGHGLAHVPCTPEVLRLVGK